MSKREDLEGKARLGGFNDSRIYLFLGKVPYCINDSPKLYAKLRDIAIKYYRKMEK